MKVLGLGLRALAVGLDLGHTVWGAGFKIQI